MALFFQRDALVQVYPNKGDGTAWVTGDRAFRIPVLEGFSFSQTTNASEITLSEMQDSAGQSRRGRKSFNDSLAPVDWSFSTYLRPFLSASTENAGQYGDNGRQHVVDEPLWNALLAKSRIEEGGGVVQVTAVTDGGSGYTNASTVVGAGGLLAPGGAHATFTATVVSGAITALAIVTAGQYVEPPETIAGGTGGDDATIDVLLGSAEDAVINRGTVTNTSLDMSSIRSNKAALNTFTMEVKMGSLVYALTKCVVNSANISFDVDGISTVEWSGQADAIAETTATFPVTYASSYGSAVGAFTTSGSDNSLVITEGGTSADTENFIRNRLTSMTVTAVDGGASDIAQFQLAGGAVQPYSITLTGGSFSIDNGVTFLVPEELGVINKPIEHVTGPRNVTGSWTCYLAAGAAGSKEFFNDLASTAGLAVITHDFEVVFQIGGTSTAQPRVYITFPHAHIEIPSHSIEDIVSLETNFSALQSDLESNSPDDMQVSFYGV